MKKDKKYFLQDRIERMKGGTLYVSIGKNSEVFWKSVYVNDAFSKALGKGIGIIAVAEPDVYIPEVLKDNVVYTEPEGDIFESCVVFERPWLFIPGMPQTRDILLFEDGENAYEITRVKAFTDSRVNNVRSAAASG